MLWMFPYLCLSCPVMVAVYAFKYTQDLLDYMHQLEQRLEVATDNKWNEVALYYSTSE